MPKIIDEENIYKTVIDMLVSHGYEGARTKEIAKIAGVNEATLFRKYGSKAQLFEKAINRQFSKAPLRDLTYTGDLADDLVSIVQAYLQTNALYGEIIPTLLAALPRHPELKNAFSVVWENIQNLVGIIQQYQQEGELDGESPFSSLNALIGPLMTEQMFRRADLGIPISDLIPAQYVASFLAGRRV